MLGTAVYANSAHYDSRNRVDRYGTGIFGYDNLDHLNSQTSTVPADLRRWDLQYDLNGNLERLENYNSAGVLTRKEVLTYPTTNNRVSKIRRGYLAMINLSLIN